MIKPSDTKKLVEVILAQYLLNPEGVHGVPHWGRVLENGRRLAPETGADIAVIEMFAIFHDSCRKSDGWDPDHGPRGAALAWRMRRRTGLDDLQIAELVSACEWHTRGPRVDAGPTVLTCLDSDRLDIPRVGMEIQPALLFTAAARDPRNLEWAAARAAARLIPAV
ncbi:MAG: hypothetical protein ACLQDL_12485, partial [Spirochaetia bacterium]